MRKLISSGFTCILFIFLAVNCLAAGLAQEESRIADKFTQIAMSEFKSVDDSQLNYPVVISHIQEYSLKVSKALLEAKIPDKKAAMIMDKAALWYGQALEGLFNGQNFDAVIQDYSAKIADLFHQEKLDLGAQIEIVSFTSDELVDMNTLFRRFTE